VEVAGTAALLVLEGGGWDVGGVWFVAHGTSMIAGAMCVAVTLETRW